MVDAIYRQREKEFHLHLERIKICDFRNENRLKNSPVTKPSDLFHLSMDDEQEKEEEKPMSFKEAKASLGSKFRK